MSNALGNQKCVLQSIYCNANKIYIYNVTCARLQYLLLCVVGWVDFNLSDMQSDQNLYYTTIQTLQTYKTYPNLQNLFKPIQNYQYQSKHI